VKNKISLLIPTRNRYNNIVRLIKSVKETANYFENIEILLYVDNDDTSTINSIKQNRADLHGAKVYVGQQTTLGKAYNALCKNCIGDVIMSGADDIVFKTKNWDTILLDKYNSLDSKIALFAANDLYTDPNEFSTHPFLTREAINCFGFFIPNEFDCNYADRWWSDVFKGIDRYFTIPIIIEHLHWLNGKAVRDNTYANGSANMNRHSEQVFIRSHDQRTRLKEQLKFNISQSQNIITLVLNTRAQPDNLNRGSISNFLDSLNQSIYCPNNIEVIFKIDTDDPDSLNELDSIIETKKYPFDVKYVNTDRVFYKGLHIGYKQAFDIRNKNSKVVFAMADDFIFQRHTWDKKILESIQNYNKDEIFILTDYIGEEGCNPVAPGWSSKMIELCDGFGPTFSTDWWTSCIAKKFLEKNFDIVIIYEPFLKRLTLDELDGPKNIRWHTDRKEMIEYHRTEEYKEYLDKITDKLIKYHESTFNGK